MASQIHTAPPNSGEVVLGRTLPSLLDEAAEKHPNATAFNQPAGEGWRSMSNAGARDAADEIALGLLENGLEKGDRVAFFLNSDLYFVLADFGTLIAGLVNVPIYVTNPAETTAYVLEHSESKAIFVSDDAFMEIMVEVLPNAPTVKKVILCEGNAAAYRDRLPEGVDIISLDDVRAAGRDRRGRSADEPKTLRKAIKAHDLATIIYTSGTTGTPKGVMLHHENITSNAFAVFTGAKEIGLGDDETVLTFLPATHIFARMLNFLHAWAGHSLYFSNPDRLVADLPSVRPTMFATVPRVLEKVYDKVTMGVESATGIKKIIAASALNLARSYEIGTEPTGLTALQYKLADKLVYSKLREKLGLTRIKYVVSGGAALRRELANVFTAMGITTLQGYGLTETSPVISFNRPYDNKAGTVGQPIAGVEVRIAEDGEILTRGPHLMIGYYKSEEQTKEVIDDEGWFHTGDIGKVDARGNVLITDRKKALFKLSTGKYVIPTPVESKLLKESLIEQAVLLGSGQKYCTALIFPNEEGLRGWASAQGLDGEVDLADLLNNPTVRKEYERLVDEANHEVPEEWSQVKRFKLVPSLMTVENELLTPTMKVKRRQVSEAFESEIENMYGGKAETRTATAV